MLVEASPLKMGTSGGEVGRRNSCPPQTQLMHREKVQLSIPLLALALISQAFTSTFTSLLKWTSLQVSGVFEEMAAGWGGMSKQVDFVSGQSDRRHYNHSPFLIHFLS